MIIPAFSISRLPQIMFGAGRFAELVPLIGSYGVKKILLVTGGTSFKSSARWGTLTDELGAARIDWTHRTVSGEPSPRLIDDTVAELSDSGIEMVIAIGGGSVMDAAKAVAGLLPFGNSVLDHLEGVGRGIPYAGPALPFIAVPTTAGTGSEATKNAVLSVQGEDGYKKSFRHDTLVPSFAVVDPNLLDTCPPSIIAANGMDALTQLLESYVSSRANPITDALAFSGIQAVKNGFFAAWRRDDPNASEGRTLMAYAALLSGITLAQVGLGSVHGLASPLGAFFPVPHGVACGSLVAVATEVNIRAMGQREPDNPSLKKFADTGRLLTESQIDDNAAQQALVDTLRDWTRKFEIPKLRHYGINEQHFAKIVANSRGSSMKTNPIVLTDEEIGEILEKCV